LIDGLKKNPYSRRHIVTAWNPGQIDEMALPPCHCLFQFHVARSKDTGPDWLSCQLYQRSADLFLGVPFNIASYALLTQMVAQVTGLRPAKFVHTLRDYRPLPKMNLNREVQSIFDFKFEDFELVNYDPHPHIKGEVAV